MVVLFLYLLDFLTFMDIFILKKIMDNFNDLVVVDVADLLEYGGKKVFHEIFSGLCSSMYFTLYKFDPVDIFTTGNTGIWSVWEIKNRSEKYTSRSFKDHIIELYKYDALMSYADRYRPFYVMVYPDAILIWNVSKIDRSRFNEEKDKYPKATAEESEKVPKEVAHLLRSECCWIIERKQKVNE